MQTIGKTKGLYGLWAKQDAITLLQDYVNSGSLIVASDTGKIYANCKLETNTPWYFINRADRDCFLYHRVFFEMCKIMPSYCLNCWKVVVAPRNLKEAWKWMEVMKGLDRKSKIGIELRPEVGRLYGSYFYNSSLEEGLECLGIVTEAIKQNDIDVLPLKGKKAILKRGCTEFEREFGPSDKWESVVTEKTLAKEKLISDWLVSPEMPSVPPNVAIRTFRSWVEWAYQHQDETYKDFIEGCEDDFDLLTKTVIYNDAVIGEHA